MRRAERGRGLVLKIQAANLRCRDGRSKNGKRPRGTTRTLDSSCRGMRFDTVARTMNALRAVSEALMRACGMGEEEEDAEMVSAWEGLLVRVQAKQAPRPAPITPETLPI